MNKKVMIDINALHSAIDFYKKIYPEYLLKYEVCGSNRELKVNVELHCMSFEENDNQYIDNILYTILRNIGFEIEMISRMEKLSDIQIRGYRMSAVQFFNGNCFRTKEEAEEMAKWKDDQCKINWKKVAKKEYGKLQTYSRIIDVKNKEVKMLGYELNKKALEIANLNDEIAILKRKLAKYEEI